MKKYKIGIIGYGGFGKFLHYWWAKLANVEVASRSSKPKARCIGNCVQSILTNLIRKIENKDHKLTVSIEDAHEGLKIAILASKN